MSYRRPVAQSGGLAIGATAIARAAGQHGRVSLPLEIHAVRGLMGNPGTLIEIDWSVGEDGKLTLALMVDGIPAWIGLLAGS